MEDENETPREGNTTLREGNATHREGKASTREGKASTKEGKASTKERKTSPKEGEQSQEQSKENETPQEGKATKERKATPKAGEQTQGQSKVDDIPPNTDEIPPNTDEIPSKVDEIPSKVDEIPSKVDEIPSKIDEIPSKIDEIPSKIDEIPSKIDEIPSKIDEMPTDGKVRDKERSPSLDRKESQGASSEGMITETVTVQTVTTTTTTKITRPRSSLREADTIVKIPVVQETISTGSIDRQTSEERSPNILKPTTIPSSLSLRKISLTLLDLEFAQQCLEVHNEYRTKHRVPPLELCNDLCKYAKQWATIVANEEDLRNRPETKYGENIYGKWSTTPNSVLTGKEVVETWYSSISSYTFGTEPLILKSGQFTQIVWKGTQHFGVAQVRSKTGKQYVVANYDPPGNIVGSFISNVMTVE